MWVNHNYRIILIRNRKAASTTLSDLFGKCSASGANPSLCIERASVQGFAQRGLTPEQAWASYFVFTSSRNPFARWACLRLRLRSPHPTH